MKKKSISLLLSGLLAVTLLTGCGGAGSETAATSATETTAGQADSQEQSQGLDSSGSQDENGENPRPKTRKALMLTPKNPPARPTHRKAPAMQRARRRQAAIPTARISPCG